jgi:hypothetical protein
MSMSLEADPQPPEQEAQASWDAPVTLGEEPAFPVSPPPPREESPGPPDLISTLGGASREDQAPPKTSARSSQASTDEPPESLKAAMRKAVDVCFVLVGNLVGALSAKATSRGEWDRKRWTPTPGERELVVGPGGRLLARRVNSDVDNADAVDLAFLAAGLGVYGVRAGFDLELPDLEEEPSDG